MKRDLCQRVIEDALSEIGYRLVLSDTIHQVGIFSSTFGYTVPEYRAVRVLATLSDRLFCHTLLHEYAHARMHGVNCSLSENEMEKEAELFVSYVEGILSDECVENVDTKIWFIAQQIASMFTDTTIYA